MKPIGIIGGTGFDKFAQGATSESIRTQYGKPSSPVFSMEIGGRELRFIYRHGIGKERVPPPFVNYAANMEALRYVGCENVIVTTAVGDLLSRRNVGALAVPNQLINY